MSQAQKPSVVDCAGTAWTLLWKAPGPHMLAGFLLIFATSIFPSFGGIIPLRFAQPLFLAAGAWFAGFLWVGMADMAITALAGGEVQAAQLFSAFSGRRQKPTIIFGGLIALIMVVASLIAAPFMEIDINSARSGITPLEFERILLRSMIGLFIELLPLVVMAAYFFPAGFYIARGEENCFIALRKGSAVIRSAPGFWTLFWIVMTAGHFAGLFACCVGLFWALAWNCIAMGSAMISFDPELNAGEPPALDPARLV